MEQLFKLSLRDMVAGVHEQRFGAAELMRSCLAHIAEREPQVQAWEHLDLEVIAPFDALITPPAAGEAPATLEETGNPAFCTIWTLLGVPAITIPVGLGPGGLPLGLQIVGARGEDDRMLGVAAWCEAHLPFHALP